MMCLIVDANVASLVFSPTPSEDFRPIWEALLARRARAVHGGHLTTEYQRIASIRRLLIELGRQGILRKVNDAQVEAATLEFQRLDIVSDDPHILGLAQVGRVRLLCSHDEGLHADFTNPRILSPGGSVYQTVAHRHLIRQHCQTRSQERGRPTTSAPSPKKRKRS